MNSRVPLNNNPPRSVASRRRAVITISLMLATLLNAGAVGLASVRARAPLPTHQPASRTTVVLLPPAAAPLLAVSPKQTLVEQLPLRPGRPAQPEPVPQEKPQPTLGANTFAALDTPAAGDPVAAPVRFYTFQEVDRAAEPDTDWPIDVETLDAIGIARLVFEVLVDDRGTVISCTVLDPSGLPEAARIDLEQRLAATSLRPALRDGRFVASQRRIELLIEPAT